MRSATWKPIEHSSPCVGVRFCPFLQRTMSSSLYASRRANHLRVWRHVERETAAATDMDVNPFEPSVTYHGNESTKVFSVLQDQLRIRTADTTCSGSDSGLLQMLCAKYPHPRSTPQIRSRLMLRACKEE